MATLSVPQYFHPKYSLDMQLKEIANIDINNKIPNSHISFSAGEPCLDYPLRAKFIFDKIETPSFRGALPTDNYAEASSKLKGEFKIPLKLINTGDAISVGLLSLCTSKYIGIDQNTASKLGYEDYKRFEVYEHPEIRGFYSYLEPQSPIRKAIVTHYNSNPELTQQELINFIRDYIGDSDVFICVKKYLRRLNVGTQYSYLKPYYYLEYYFLDSIELPFNNAIKGICPVCMSQWNKIQLVIGKKTRRLNDKGVNYMCTGLGAGMGALIGGPIGAIIGGAAGKLIGNQAEDTNSSTCSYEFECPKCHHKWTEERSKTD